MLLRGLLVALLLLLLLSHAHGCSARTTAVGCVSELLCAAAYALSGPASAAAPGWYVAGAGACNCSTAKYGAQDASSCCTSGDCLSC